LSAYVNSYNFTSSTTWEVHSISSAKSQVGRPDLGITRSQLLEKRGDLSQFLIHLARTGHLKLAKDIYSLPQDTVVQLSARNNLEAIIKSRRIEARSAFGYFNYKVPLRRADGRVLNSNSYVRRDWLRSVCFTETPLDHVHLQMQVIYGRQLHFEPYGLGFREEVVRGANGNPVLYVQTTNQNIRAALDELAIDPLAHSFKAMMPLVEGFGPPWFPRQTGPMEIDFRWEREWRVAGDFSFALSDVAFGFCPEREIQQFESLVGKAFPFVDPAVANLQAAKQKLRAWPHLKDLK